MKLTRFFIAMVLVVANFSVRASVQINATRVIYNAADKDVSVQVTNPGKYPVLLQAWLDAGQPDIKPGKITTPFVLTPPLSRVNEGAGQTLRLSFVGPALPGDRESVYWINVLEIPPLTDKATSQMQLAFRSRIKLFYRPSGLNAREAAKAVQQLRWQAARGKITVTNPAPYFISLTQLKIDGRGKTLMVSADMLAPGSEASFPLPEHYQLTGREKVTAIYINDYGAINTHSITYQ